MQREIVMAAVESAADIDLVEARAGVDPLVEIDRIAPDVVLVEGDDPETTAVPLVRRSHAPLRVVSLTADGRTATLTELYPRSVVLGNLTPATLVETLRAAGRTSEVEC